MTFIYRQGLSCLTYIFFSLMLVLPATAALADELSACSDSFYGGIYPEFANKKLSQGTQPLCFSGFAVMYSGVTKTPLWSAEHLTKKRINDAKKISREDNFHEESRLPKSIRATLSDYSKSGFDRGHLAPNGNMANRQQQYDSFSLANIAPQSPRNNRYIWRNIETATRQLTQQYGEVYSVTGVAFLDTKVKTLKGRVLVPSHFYKAVYIPKLNQAGAYFAPNDESERIEVISINELTDKVGIDVLPVLDGRSKSQALNLPLDANHSPSLDTPENKAPTWQLFVMAIVDWLVTQFQA